MRYPGPQLRLLILLALTLLAGLGVREWRAGFPDAAERLERFDREDDAAILPEPVSARPAPLAPPRPSAATGPGAPPSDRTGSGAFARGGAAASGDGAGMAWAPSRRADPGRPAAAPVAHAPAPPTAPLDVNRADAPALSRLPGVSPALAQRIVEERERRGRFESPEALRYVLGMGPKKLAAIRPFITVRD